MLWTMDSFRGRLELRLTYLRLGMRHRDIFQTWKEAEMEAWTRCFRLDLETRAALC